MSTNDSGLTVMKAGITMDVWNKRKLTYTLTSAVVGTGFEARNENGMLAVYGEIHDDGTILFRSVFCTASCELPAILARASWLLV